MQSISYLFFLITYLSAILFQLDLYQQQSFYHYNYLIFFCLSIFLLQQITLLYREIYLLFIISGLILSYFHLSILILVEYYLQIPLTYSFFLYDSVIPSYLYYFHTSQHTIPNNYTTPSGVDIIATNSGDYSLFVSNNPKRGHLSYFYSSYWGSSFYVFCIARAPSIQSCCCWSLGPYSYAFSSQITILLLQGSGLLSSLGTASLVFFFIFFFLFSREVYRTLSMYSVAYFLYRFSQSFCSSFIFSLS